VYSKIPQLQLPSDANGELVFSRDLKAYSKDAISNQVSTAIQNGSALPQSINSTGAATLHLGGQSSYIFQDRDAMPTLTNLLKTSPLGSSTAYGLNLPNPSEVNMPSQYYVSENGARTPVDQTSVPQELQSASFPSATTPTFTYAAPDWWSASPSASQTFSAQLNDGSSVDYRWYKFVDQPALQRFELTDAEKANLQSAVEKIQKEWSNSSILSNPSSGSLAKFDSGLTVTPPTGLEIGYVPIVIKQYFGPPTFTATPATTPTPTKLPSAIVPSTPSQSPSPSPSPSATKSLLTRLLTCMKGKSIKKVSGTSPKCPSGYKIKK